MRFVALLVALLFSLARSYESKPPFWKKAETARWLAHQNVWGTLSTSSVHLQGQAWGQPKSFVDGTVSNSTGNLYFYDSDMDTSLQDIAKDNRVAFSLSMAEQGLCTVTEIDPEDPRCARVVFSGDFVPVTDEDELKFAKLALFERHPQMVGWPTDHSWRVHKVAIREIWLIGIYGGASIVDIQEYYEVKHSQA